MAFERLSEKAMSTFSLSLFLLPILFLYLISFYLLMSLVHVSICMRVLPSGNFSIPNSALRRMQKPTKLEMKGNELDTNYNNVILRKSHSYKGFRPLTFSHCHFFCCILTYKTYENFQFCHLCDFHFNFFSFLQTKWSAEKRKRSVQHIW